MTTNQRGPLVPLLSSKEESEVLVNSLAAASQAWSSSQSLRPLSSSSRSPKCDPVSRPDGAAAIPLMKAQQWIPFDKQVPVGPAELVFGDMAAGSLTPPSSEEETRTGACSIAVPRGADAPVYLASEYGARSEQVFHDLNIGAVVNVTTGHQRVDNVFEGKGVRYLNLEIFDQPGANIFDAIHSALPTIRGWRDSGICTLVHCQAGLSRSASIVVALRMDLFHETLAEAVTFVEQKRGRRLQINPSFWMDLAKFERELFSLPPNTPPTFDFAPWWVEGFGSMGVSEATVRRALASTGVDYVNFEPAFAAMFE